MRRRHNYSSGLINRKYMHRLKEARSLLRSTIHVARRVLGENDQLTLKLRWNDARALAGDPGSTLDDIREAMTMLEDLTRITRRVFGSAHPLVALCEDSLRLVRKKLGASETPAASAQSTK